MSDLTIKHRALVGSATKAAFDAANGATLTTTLLDTLFTRGKDELIFICVQELVALHVARGGAPINWTPPEG